MALAANIDAANALIDGLRTQRQSILADRAAIRDLEQTMIAEVQDAQENGLGPLSPGFLPDANGKYIVQRGNRAIEVEWSFDTLTVLSVRVLRPNEFIEQVANV
jgi:hypothetical protein